MKNLFTNKALLSVVLTLVLCVSAQILFAQPPPPPPPPNPAPPGAPIDGGVVMLISAMLGYAYYKFKA